MLLCCWFAVCFSCLFVSSFVDVLVRVLCYFVVVLFCSLLICYGVALLC